MSYTVEDLDAAVESLSWVDLDGHDDLPEFDDEDHRRDYIFDYYGGPEGWDVLGEKVYYHPKYDSHRHQPTVTLDGIGTAKMVEQFGGEGGGDKYWFILSVTDADGNERLFRRNGWYASFDGGYYEGPTEEVVEATETVKVYKAI